MSVLVCSSARLSLCLLLTAARASVASALGCVAALVRAAALSLAAGSPCWRSSSSLNDARGAAHGDRAAFVGARALRDPIPAARGTRGTVSSVLVNVTYKGSQHAGITGVETEPRAVLREGFDQGGLSRRESDSRDVVRGRRRRRVTCLGKVGVMGACGCECVALSVQQRRTI